MAGHSHFANIKHKKAANDSKKQKILSKISKEIMVAIKGASVNPNDNPKLRLVLEKARQNSIPKDNIERILKGGNKNKEDYQEIIYEGYGPNGVAIIIDCLTDNVNRTAAEVRASLSKNGGNLGVSGSVSYLFDTKGVILLDATQYSFDSVFEKIADLDILNIDNANDVIVIETDKKDLLKIKEELEKKDIKEFLKVEIEKVPNQIVLLDEDNFSKIEKLIDVLENLDDVQNVYTNSELIVK